MAERSWVRFLLPPNCSKISQSRAKISLAKLPMLQVLISNVRWIKNVWQIFQGLIFGYVVRVWPTLVSSRDLGEMSVCASWPKALSSCYVQWPWLARHVHGADISLLVG